MDAEMTMLALRAVGSFALVGVLLWLLSRAGRGRLGTWLGGGSSNVEQPLVIIARQQLTRSGSIAVVRAGRRHLLIGYGESGIVHLADGDDLAPASSVASQPRAEPPASSPASSGASPSEVSMDPEADRAADIDLSAPAGRSGVGDSAAEGDGPHPGRATARPARNLPAVGNRPPRQGLVDALRDRTVRR